MWVRKCNALSVLSIASRDVYLISMLRHASTLRMAAFMRIRERKEANNGRKRRRWGPGSRRFCGRTA
jgi:hypothetical protein